jgi:SAICAR synthetase
MASNSPTSTSSPRVLLLVSTIQDAAFANSVCECLSSEFQIPNASVRSLQVPLDRLEATSDGIDSPATLWVLLSSDNNRSRLPTVLPCMTEWMDPVLEIEVTTTATTAKEDTSLRIAKFCSLNNSNPAVRQAIQAAIMVRRQARLVEDAQLHTQSPAYEHAIARCFDESRQISGDFLMGSSNQQEVVLRLQEKRQVGKVRDRYEGEQYLALVTTDRQSGFDRQLARVPFKGAVLNLTSAYWFEKTKHIIPNHLVAVPHPNVSIVKKCKPFPIEFVVR